MSEPTFRQKEQQVGAQDNADIININGQPVPQEGQAGAAFVPVSWRGKLSRSVPQSNPFFTGRKDELERLHTLLQSVNTALTPVPQALQGLDGVGKTSIACEYAHRFRHEYAGVWWVIGETPEQLASQLAGLADELFPNQAVPADQNIALQQVHQWFAAQEGWLLVVDNAEHLSALEPVLPPLATGLLLLTTREKATGGLAQRVEIECLDEADGALFLLRRASKLTHAQTPDAADAAWQDGAKSVSRELDGLPLALDQAGAYIMSCGITPQQYLALYYRRQQRLHTDYANPHHASVSVTFELALEQVRRIPYIGEAAAELAQLCAFLAPDPIPDEVFTTQEVSFGNRFTRLLHGESKYEELWEAACRYALLGRTANPSGLTMHRLAQEVVRDGLDEAQQEALAERAMLTVAGALPYPDFPVWPLWSRMLPHALACIQHIQEYTFHTSTASILLNKTGSYLKEHARYAQAEQFLMLSLSIDRRVHGEEHATVAACLNNLGLLYYNMGRYEEAASHLEEAVAIQRRVWGEEDAKYATSLDNLASVYHLQDHNEEAAALHERALDITRRALGSRHPDVAARLNCLAIVYISIERYKDAEAMLLEALEISRDTIGQDDPTYATRLMNLAALYIDWSRPDEADSLLTQALSIVTQAHGSQHPRVASCYFWLGRMHYTQDNLTKAFTTFLRAWEIRERVLGPQHPDTAVAREWVDDVQDEMEPSSGLRPPSPLQGEG